MARNPLIGAFVLGSLLLSTLAEHHNTERRAKRALVHNHRNREPNERTTAKPLQPLNERQLWTVHHRASSSALPVDQPLIHDLRLLLNNNDPPILPSNPDYRLLREIEQLARINPLLEPILEKVPGSSREARLRNLLSLIARHPDKNPDASLRVVIGKAIVALNKEPEALCDILPDYYKNIALRDVQDRLRKNEPLLSRPLTLFMSKPLKNDVLRSLLISMVPCEYYNELENRKVVCKDSQLPSEEAKELARRLLGRTTTSTTTTTTPTTTTTTTTRRTTTTTTPTTSTTTKRTTTTKTTTTTLPLTSELPLVDIGPLRTIPKPKGGPEDRLLQFIKQEISNKTRPSDEEIIPAVENLSEDKAEKLANYIFAFAAFPENGTLSENFTLPDDSRIQMLPLKTIVRTLMSRSLLMTLAPAPTTREISAVLQSQPEAPVIGVIPKPKVGPEERLIRFINTHVTNKTKLNDAGIAKAIEILPNHKLDKLVVLIKEFVIFPKSNTLNENFRLPEGSRVKLAPMKTIIRTIIDRLENDATRPLSPEHEKLVLRLLHPVDGVSDPQQKHVFSVLLRSLEKNDSEALAIETQRELGIYPAKAGDRISRPILIKILKEALGTPVQSNIQKSPTKSPKQYVQVSIPEDEEDLLVRIMLHIRRKIRNTEPVEKVDDDHLVHLVNQYLLLTPLPEREDLNREFRKLLPKTVFSIPNDDPELHKTLIQLIERRLYSPPPRLSPEEEELLKLMIDLVEGKNSSFQFDVFGRPTNSANIAKELLHVFQGHLEDYTDRNDAVIVIKIGDKGEEIKLSNLFIKMIIPELKKRENLIRATIPPPKLIRLPAKKEYELANEVVRLMHGHDVPNTETSDISRAFAKLIDKYPALLNESIVLDPKNNITLTLADGRKVVMEPEEMQNILVKVRVQLNPSNNEQPEIIYPLDDLSTTEKAQLADLISNELQGHPPTSKSHLTELSRAIVKLLKEHPDLLNSSVVLDPKSLIVVALPESAQQARLTTVALQKILTAVKSKLDKEKEPLKIDRLDPKEEAELVKEVARLVKGSPPVNEKYRTNITELSEGIKELLNENPQLLKTNVVLDPKSRIQLRLPHSGQVVDVSPKVLQDVLAKVKKAVSPPPMEPQSLADLSPDELQELATNIKQILDGKRSPQDSELAKALAKLLTENPDLLKENVAVDPNSKIQLKLPSEQIVDVPPKVLEDLLVKIRPRPSTKKPSPRIDINNLSPVEEDKLAEEIKGILNGVKDENSSSELASELAKLLKKNPDLLKDNVKLDPNSKIQIRLPQTGDVIDINPEALEKLLLKIKSNGSTTQKPQEPLNVEALNPAEEDEIARRVSDLLDGASEVPENERTNLTALSEAIKTLLDDHPKFLQENIVLDPKSKIQVRLPYSGQIANIAPTTFNNILQKIRSNRQATTTVPPTRNITFLSPKSEDILAKQVKYLLDGGNPNGIKTELAEAIANLIKSNPDLLKDNVSLNPDQQIHLQLQKSGYFVNMAPIVLEKLIAKIKSPGFATSRTPSRSPLKIDKFSPKEEKAIAGEVSRLIDDGLPVDEDQRSNLTELAEAITKLIKDKPDLLSGNVAINPRSKIELQLPNFGNTVTLAPKALEQILKGIKFNRSVPENNLELSPADESQLAKYIKDSLNGTTSNSEISPKLIDIGNGIVNLIKENPDLLKENLGLDPNSKIQIRLPSSGKTINVPPKTMENLLEKMKQKTPPASLKPLVIKSFSPAAEDELAKHIRFILNGHAPDDQHRSNLSDLGNAIADLIEKNPDLLKDNISLDPNSQIKVRLPKAERDAFIAPEALEKLLLRVNSHGYSSSTAATPLNIEYMTPIEEEKLADSVKLILSGKEPDESTSELAKALAKLVKENPNALRENSGLDPNSKIQLRLPQTGQIVNVSPNVINDLLKKIRPFETSTRPNHRENLKIEHFSPDEEEKLTGYLRLRIDGHQPDPKGTNLTELGEAMYNFIQQNPKLLESDVTLDPNSKISFRLPQSGKIVSMKPETFEKLLLKLRPASSQISTTTTIRPAFTYTRLAKGMEDDIAHQVNHFLKGQQPKRNHNTELSEVISDFLQKHPGFLKDPTTINPKEIVVGVRFRNGEKINFLPRVMKSLINNINSLNGSTKNYKENQTTSTQAPRTTRRIKPPMLHYDKLSNEEKEKIAQQVATLRQGQNIDPSQENYNITGVSKSVVQLIKQHPDLLNASVVLDESSKIVLNFGKKGQQVDIPPNELKKLVARMLEISSPAKSTIPLFEPSKADIDKLSDQLAKLLSNPNAPKDSKESDLMEVSDALFNFIKSNPKYLQGDEQPNSDTVVTLTESGQQLRLSPETMKDIISSTRSKLDSAFKMTKEEEDQLVKDVSGQLNGLSGDKASPFSRALTEFIRKNPKVKEPGVMVEKESKINLKLDDGKHVSVPPEWLNKVLNRIRGGLAKPLNEAVASTGRPTRQSTSKIPSTKPVTKSSSTTKLTTRSYPKSQATAFEQRKFKMSADALKRVLKLEFDCKEDVKLEEIPETTELIPNSMDEFVYVGPTSWITSKNVKSTHLTAWAVADRQKKTFYYRMPKWLYLSLKYAYAKDCQEKNASGR